MCHLHYYLIFNDCLTLKTQNLIFFCISSPDHIDCYVHSVTDIKKGPQKNYFGCTLQTKDQGVISALCFSPEKKSQFDDIKLKRSPVKIKNFRVSDKYGIKVLVDDTVKIEDVVEPGEFMPIANGDQEPVPIATLSKITLGQVVTIKAKVADISGVKIQIMDDKSKVNRQQTIIHDSSGSIKLTLWGKYTDTLEIGHTYLIKKVRVRKDKFGEIYVNSIKSGETSFNDTDDFATALAPITTTLVSPSVTECQMKLLGIHTINKHLVCCSCHKKANPIKNGKYAKCEGKMCALKQKVSTCGTSWYMKLYLQLKEDPTKKLALAAYDHIVRKLETLCPIPFDISDEEDITEALLDLGHLNVTFDSFENKIMEIDYQPEFDI